MLVDFNKEERITVECKDYSHSGRFVAYQDGLVIVRVMGVQVCIPTSDIIRIGTYLPPLNGKGRVAWF